MHDDSHQVRANVIGADEVVITWPGYVHGGEATSALAKAGLSIVFAPNRGRLRTSEEMSQLLARARAAIISTDPIDRAVIAAAPGLRVIARTGIGLDAVDVEAATQAGVAVTTAPGSNEETCADHTLALMLAVVRRIVENHELLESGGWDRIGPLTPWELHRTTVGLIGFGRIGRAVARRLRGFEATVLVHDPVEVRNGDDVEQVDLDELLTRSQIVSLHCPLTPATHGLIGEPQLACMRPDAVLVNTSRGELVDTAALYGALANGRLRGAGLDVFDPEPVSDLRLLSLSNVVCSPHIGGISTASVERLTAAAVRSVVDVLSGRVPAGLVNPAAMGAIHRVRPEAHDRR